MVNVQELQHKSIPEIIRILGIFENEDVVTVDLAELVYTLKVSALARNFESAKIAGEKILAAFVTNSKGNSCIFYSNDLSHDEARLIITRAFAKYIITGNNNFFVTQSTNFSKREKSLTNEMLMPEIKVKDVICKLILPSTTVLTEIFQVSQEFVKLRLDEIGIMTLIQGYNTQHITQKELVMLKLAEMGLL